MFRLALPLLVLAMAPQLTADDQDGDKTKGPDPLHPRVKMETSLGDIVLELNAEKAPITVDNFLRYTADDFYNETIFHRIVRKDPPRSTIDVIQGGGFTADMETKGGLRPPIKNEWRNGLKNERGTISMARGRAPDSATSQFFINTADNQGLDMPRGGAAYAVFGRVVAGTDVVDKIRSIDLAVHAKLARMGKVVPVEPIVVKSVTLLDGLTHDQVAEKIKPVIEAAAEAEAKYRAAAKAKAEAMAKEEARLADDERAKAFKELLAKGEDKKGRKLEKTESGLMYVVLRPGDGPSPQPTDVVEVHYIGWLLNGKQFDSSAKRGEPVAFALNGVIKGWTEGVGLMKVGGRRLLIIPADLAYGERGRPGIPPNAMLVFDIELLLRI